MKARSALLAVLLLGLASLSAAGLDNPLIPRRADPFVYLHADGYYYFCATVPGYDRLELSRARDLEGLRSAIPVVVWKKQRRLFLEDRNLWAPELHRIDGKWIIYYAAGTSAAPYDVRVRAIENEAEDPMAGTWKDRGRIDTGWDTLSLDATSFELGGRRYLVWAQRLTKSDASSMDLYIAPMRDAAALAGKASMIGRADQAWELRDPANRKMQGPAVLKRNGRVFIAYSSNATDARYCVGLLEARDDADPLDPVSWKKLPGPAFESDPAAGVYGPGHNSFTTSPDGAVDYIVYHARNYEKVEAPAILDTNRGTRVQAFSWDSEGRPSFGKPLPDSRP